MQHQPGFVVRPTKTVNCESESVGYQAWYIKLETDRMSLQSP